MVSRILPKNAKLIPKEAKNVFKGEIFDVYQWPQRMFDGSTATFEMLRRPDTVCVLAIDANKKIIAVDEKQPGGITRSNHLPVGRVDPEDVSVLEAAKRELVEETGLTFNKWDLIEVTQPDAKIEWFVHTFLARDFAKEVPQHLDAGEQITVKHLEYKEIWAQAAKYCDVIRENPTIEQLCERIDS